MKKHVVLIAIVTFAIILRFYHLGDVPVGFHRDEAYLGYNAYSILQTVKDMNGHMLPIHLESFLFSPAGYSYFSIPFIGLFGLSEFSVRFASAFFGSLSVVLLYMLVKELFYKEKYSNGVALLSALLLSISPWHITLSRTATENTIVVFFILLGTWFLLIPTKKRYVFLLLSFFSFAITLVIYQAPRAFLPFYIPLLGIYLYLRNKKLITIRYTLIASGLYILLICLPLAMIMSSPQLSVRIKGLNVFQHPETKLVLEEQIREDGVAGEALLITRVFHNKIVGYSQLLLQNYFSHLSYEFLFTDNGFPQRYRIHKTGLLHPIELPLLLIGVVFLLTKYRREAIFLIAWIMIAPIGSALTYDDVPNLQRTLFLTPALYVFIAMGMYCLYWYVKKTRLFLVIILSSCFVFSLGYYVHQYYVHQIYHKPYYRQEGYKLLVEKVNKFLPDYKKAVISNYESDPTILFLFYNIYSPVRFQEETMGRFGEKSDLVPFAKYEFMNDNCPLHEKQTLDTDTNQQITRLMGEEDVLYVNAGVCEMPKTNVMLLDEVKRSDGTVAFQLLKMTDK